ncbi:MAG: F0F1 ATP synthase subunit B [Alphaproteobacteria bacterium]|jgi:F-type H+-transporting ATPase subunit b|nr:F0F1 ATP synthase subunit B [Alphaproteobacteria bacterium]
MMALLQDPTFWVAIGFVIFVVALFRPIKKALLDNLDQRIAQIRTEVEEAERLREEAQTLVATYQRQQREAKQDAEDIVAKAKVDAERHRAEAEEAMETAFARQEAQAKDKIAQAEAAAVQEVRDVAVDLAIGAAERLLAERLAGKEGDALVEDAIKELPEKLQ